jgi:hypothetical protein
MTAINLNRAVRGPVTAVPVVAGKGVKFVKDVENGRVVAKIDEVVIFDGHLPARGNTITFDEPFTNFEYIRVIFGLDNLASTLYRTEFLSKTKIALCIAGWAYNWMWEGYIKLDATTDSKVWTYSANTLIEYRNDSTSTYIYNNESTYISSDKTFKIIGINRIAGGN